MRARASIAFLAAAAMVGLNACAPSAESADGESMASRTARQCFDSDRLTNFTVDDTHTVYVEAANRDVYELQIAGGCNQLDSAFGLQITPSTGGSSRLCIGEAANIRAGTTGSTGPCRARVSRMLTPEQVAALPSRLRP